MAAQNGTVGSADTGSIDNLKDKAKHLVEQGQERAGEIKDKLIGAKDKVMSTGSDLLSSSRTLIVENPFAAVGIAFGIGYVAMRIFRR